jgi:hypothetical protein
MSQCSPKRRRNEGRPHLRWRDHILFKRREQTTHGLNHDDDEEEEEICKRLDKINSETITS